MNRYKKLLSNTVLFAIGTFSSKALVFLLMPLYTAVLSTEEYGTVDLIMQAGNLLLPLVSVGIINAIVRFGLDSSVRKSDVFTVGLMTVFCGFLVLLFFYPLLQKISYISDNIVLIYLFVLMSCLGSVCHQFVRSMELVKLYTIDGIFSTFTTIMFNILFLVVFKLGITGYVLATVCADFLSAFLLFLVARLHRYIHLKGLKKHIIVDMLKYAVPMIPNTMFWWITSASDRYIIAFYLGNDVNGLYAAASKIPTIITLFSSIFMDAWQMSAITEKGTIERNRFFTNVFGTYQALIFAVGSGLILCSKLLTMIMVSPAYYESWKFIPFLIMATSFSCLVSFLGSVYMVEKKSVLNFLTTAAGAVINIVLNFILIPRLGANGAALATFASYFTVFLLRAVDTKRFVKIRFSSLKLALNTILLLIQSLVMIFETPGWIVIEIGITVLMLLLNLKSIFESLSRIFFRLRARTVRSKKMS